MSVWASKLSKTLKMSDNHDNPELSENVTPSPGAASPLSWLSGSLESREVAGLTRRLRVRQVDPHVDFSSNDYLFFRRDPRLRRADLDSFDISGVGAGSSPAVSGWSSLHEELANAISLWKGAEATLLFSSGYMANQSTIAALVEKPDAVYADRLCHACLIDGARLSGATLRVFPHNDAAKLNEIMARDAGRFRRSLIVTESLFSMDGDIAPLVELAGIATKYNAMMAVDEAHATGLFGPAGQGLVEELGLGGVPGLVRLGTLSKAVGVQGGFVSGPEMLIRWLVQAGRGWIYSTALSPCLAGAAAESIRIIQAEPWRRERTLEVAELLRKRLKEQGWNVPEGAGPIVPVLIGDAGKTMKIGRLMEEEGFALGAIRPPTVPAGTARLRLSLHAGHEVADIERIAAALAKCREFQI